MAENMTTNAKQIYSYFISKGWTAQAICGMLGNMQAESGIIADRTEDGGGGGYGLVQWDPKSKLTNWCNANGLNYRTVSSQCARIQWELENNVQYQPKDPSIGTFREYSKSTASPTYLAKIFITNYEQPYIANQPVRGVWAEQWFSLLSNSITGGEWKQNNDGWWYVHPDGSYTKNNWEFINGIWYFFNTVGYMVTGWLSNNQKWYYLDLKSGRMYSNEWLLYKGNWYFLDTSGSMLANTSRDINGKTYYFGASGICTNPYGVKGNLDAATSTIISGWAKYLDDTPIQVHIYIYDSAGNTVLAEALIADRYRTDVGNHGYEYYINWVAFKPGTYTVTAYGIAENNPVIGKKVFIVRDCNGHVEEVSAARIKGWMWKPDAPSVRIQVHIYMYDAAGNEVFAHAIFADKYRADLLEAGIGNGYHAFEYTPNWNSLPKQVLTVAVYAFDGSGVSRLMYNKTYDNR